MLFTPSFIGADGLPPLAFTQANAWNMGAQGAHPANSRSTSTFNLDASADDETPSGPRQERSRSANNYLASPILLVDDDPTNLHLLRCILERAGYSRLVCTTNPFEVRELCEKERIDLVLLDLMMPARDGFGVMTDLEAWRDHHYLPVLVLTADSNPQSRCRALSNGATDFVTKPFNPAEVLLRVHNLLEIAHLQHQLRSQNNELEQRVRDRTQELEQLNSILLSRKAELKASQIEILERLAQAAEFHDDDTGRHTRRVGELAARIAEALGWKPARVELLRLAAPLHDVGKIGIPDYILLKKDKLTDEEFAIIKQHPEIGAQLLQNGHSALVALAHSVALTHHERFDGSGYPYGLSGKNIPMEGRIVAIADVFDALAHDRPYKTGWPVEQVITEICNHAGTQFDPHVVHAFCQVISA